MTERQPLPSDDAPDDDMPDMPLPDQPVGSDDWGITDLEQSTGEPLDQKLARERPDSAGRSRDEDEPTGEERP
jgi:hypothetical protein